MSSSNGTENHSPQAVAKVPPAPSPLWNSKFCQPKLRILVTGGAGFIGSHLVDKLMEMKRMRCDGNFVDRS